MLERFRPWPHHGVAMTSPQRPELVRYESRWAEDGTTTPLMLSSEPLGRPGKCLVLGRPSRSVSMPWSRHSLQAPASLPVLSPILFFSSTAHNPPARPNRAPLLVFFGDSVRGPRRGMSRSWLLEGRERFEMMSLEDRVLSRCAIPPGPVTPQHPPATGRPACAGSRFRESWYAV